MAPPALFELSLEPPPHADRIVRVPTRQNALFTRVNNFIVALLITVLSSYVFILSTHSVKLHRIKQFVKDNEKIIVL